MSAPPPSHLAAAMYNAESGVPRRDSWSARRPSLSTNRTYAATHNGGSGAVPFASVVDGGRGPSWLPAGLGGRRGPPVGDVHAALDAHHEDDYHARVLSALADSGDRAARAEALGVPRCATACCGCLGGKRLPLRTRCAIGWFVTLAVLVLLGVLVFYFVAPVYVRSRLAATTLTFTAIRLTNPVWPTTTGVGDGGSGYGLTIDASAVLSGLSPVDGTLHAMATTLSFAGTPVATFTLPQFTAVAGVDNYIHMAAPAALTSLDAFTSFGAALLAQTSVSFTLSGTATVSTSLAGVTITIDDVPFSKTIVTPGAGGLAQSSVLRFSLTGSNATAAVANMTVQLVSPAIVTIEPLGDLAVGVVYNGMSLGTMLTPNATLAPGVNNFTFTGVLTPDNTTLTQRLISDYLAGVAVNVTAGGIGAWPSSLPIYRSVIDAVVLNASLHTTGTPLVHGVSVGAMHLEAAGLDAVSISLNTTVQINNIMGADSPIYVDSVSLNVTLQGSGLTLGQLIIPTTPVPGGGQGGDGWHADDPTAPVVYLRSSGGGYYGSADDGSGAASGQMAGAVVHGARASRHDTPLRLVGSPFVWCGDGGGCGDGAEAGAAVRDGDDDLPLLNVTLHVSALLAIDATAVEFSRFILTFMNNATVVLGLVSSAPTAMVANLRCVLGNLTVSIPLDVTATVPAIDSFPVVAVNSFSVIGTEDEPEAAVLVGMNVSMLNPSPATFPLGTNTTLGIRYGGYRLGGATAYNVTLQPGMNNLYLTGRVQPERHDVDGALAATSRLFSRYLVGENTSVEVVGESVYVGDDAPTPQWLIDAVHNISLAAMLPGAANLTMFSDVHLVSFNIDMPPDGSPTASPMLAGVVAGNVHLPFSIPVNIPAVNMTLVYNDPVAGTPMASVSLVTNDVAYVPVPDPEPAPPGSYPMVGAMTLTLARTPLTIIDEAAFAQFMRAALNAPIVDLLLTGSASPTVCIVIGNLSIADIPVSQYASTPGMNGFSDPPIELLGLAINGTGPGWVDMSATLNITNPSVVAGSLGSVALNLTYGGYILFTAAVPSLAVSPGPNLLTGGGRFYMPDAAEAPGAYAAARRFLSNYLSGIPSEVTVTGSTASSPLPLLGPAFAALNATCTLPPVPDHLLVNGTLFMDWDNINWARSNGSLCLTNPLAAEFQLLTANLTVFDCWNQTADGLCESAPDYGSPIAYFYDGDLMAKPLILPPSSVSCTKTYELRMEGAFGLGGGGQSNTHTCAHTWTQHLTGLVRSHHLG